MSLRDAWHSIRFLARLLGASCLLLLFNFQPLRGQNNSDDLTKISIETLMNMEVNSAARKEQTISKTAAAIYVITQEDIRRSGFNSLPELLRMVPGLDVAHIDTSQWAISARGFNARRAKKLLVLIDGRSIYWPAYGNVYWEVQDLMLEDIERIEVIRGPGATLWGVSAINGVVNVITKSSRSTQGTLISAGAGVQERGFGAARFGGQVGGKGHYRVYAKGFNRAQFDDIEGKRAGDDWHVLHGGFRTDWALSTRDSLTVQGDLYQGLQNQQNNFFSLTFPFSVQTVLQTRLIGGNLIGRWSRVYSKRSDLSLQVYYDTDARNSSYTSLFVKTTGFDFQNRFGLGARHDVLWGAGYRFVHDSFRNNFHESFLPATRDDSLYDAFIQDEITLVPDRLRFTAGIRFEHVPYTGYHAEPNGRLLWTPSHKQTIWASLASAKRAPTRANRERRQLTFISPGPSGTPIARAIIGSPNFGDEAILALELGYRAQPNDRTSFDLATFYNRYQHLQTLEPGISFLELDPAPAHIIDPRYYANLMHGKAYGAELSAGWKATNAWKLNAAYTFLRTELQRAPQSLSLTAERAKGDSPGHQVQLRSQWSFPRNLEFDQSIYFVSKLTSQPVPAYTRVDVRLGWRPTDHLEISVIGQNLLSPRHVEFSKPEGVFSTLDVRKAYVKFTWTF